MKTEDRQDFGEIKAAILRVDFESITQNGFNGNDYERGAVCAKLPKPFDVKSLLQVIDRYTSGNSGAIISPGPICGEGTKEQWLIMPPENASALKSNLRTKIPKK